jgi:hypothetical protein
VSWHLTAKCRGTDPELWLPNNYFGTKFTPRRALELASICKGCPSTGVNGPCFEELVRMKDPRFGAGLTCQERAKLDEAKIA